METSQRGSQGTPEQIKKGEDMMTPEQRATQEQRAYDFALNEMTMVLEHTKNGKLGPQDAVIIDDLLESLSNLPAEIMIKTLVADEKEKEEARQSKPVQMLIEMFSDPKSLATIKKFALGAYEESALHDPDSHEFRKLKKVAGFMEEFGNDNEIANRFSCPEVATQSGSSIVTQEEETIFHNLGFTDVKAGDVLPTMTFSRPKWIYKK
jgi:hypothetical protein